jgi:transposase
MSLIFLMAWAVGAAERLGPGDHTRTLQVAGRERSYLLHIPPTYDPQRPTPVVLAEHREQRANGTMDVRKPRQGRGSVVDAYEPTLREFLSRYPDMTVVRLLEECRARGYTGGYTVLRQRIKQLRKQGHRPPVERFETGPGVQAQMDWATYTIDFSQEGRRKVNLFSYVLGYSRRQ